MQSATRKSVKTLLWFLCSAWFIFLVWLSSQDGPATARTSMGLADFLARFLDVPPEKLNRWLRVAAHFVGFLILGGLAYLAARTTWPAGEHTGVFVLLICCTAAVLDEVKKVFIPGRHLSWPEAGLNILGVLCGIAILRFIGAVRRKTV